VVARRPDSAWPDDTATIQGRKDTVRRLLRALSERRYTDANVLLTDDATWWTLSRRSAVPAAAWVAGYEQQTGPLFPDGLVLELVGLVAEGDRVAAQAVSKGLTSAGVEYANAYHFLFEFEGDRIAAAWEYGDTLYAEKVLRG
jgi:ketosteroid isomerase-like protein